MGRHDIKLAGQGCLLYGLTDEESRKDIEAQYARMKILGAEGPLRTGRLQRGVDVTRDVDDRFAIRVPGVLLDGDVIAVDNVVVTMAASFKSMVTQVESIAVRMCRGEVRSQLTYGNLDVRVVLPLGGWPEGKGVWLAGFRGGGVEFMFILYGHRFFKVDDCRLTRVYVEGGMMHILVDYARVLYDVVLEERGYRCITAKGYVDEGDR